MLTQKEKVIQNNTKKAFKLHCQLVLFNNKELKILQKLQPSHKGIENIKKMKHLFHGTLV